MKIVFVVHFKNGKREQYISSYDEGKENSEDSAYDEVYNRFPNADYIERI